MRVGGQTQEQINFAMYVSFVFIPLMDSMLYNLAELGDRVLEAPWAAFITQPASVSSPSRQKEDISAQWREP